MNLLSEQKQSCYFAFLIRIPPSPSPSRRKLLNIWNYNLLAKICFSVDLHKNIPKETISTREHRNKLKCLHGTEIGRHFLWRDCLQTMLLRLRIIFFFLENCSLGINRHFFPTYSVGRDDDKVVLWP